MASFGTLALLLAFGILAGAGGGYGFDAIRASTHAPVVAALVLLLVCSAPVPRPVWCRFTSGYRSPIRRRRAMFPR